MTNPYLVIRDQQQAEVNAFPMIFAITVEDLHKGMLELGLEIHQKSELLSIGALGYIRLFDEPAYDQMFERHAQQLKAAIEHPETGYAFAVKMFDYELANHELLVTGDPSSTGESLECALHTVQDKELLNRALKEAIRLQFEYDNA